jgi:hypothetical protein
MSSEDLISSSTSSSNMSQISTNNSISDGYHTLTELYDQRLALFRLLMTLYCNASWKAYQHHDLTILDGWFLVGIDFPNFGTISYYARNSLWDSFKVRILEKAPLNNLTSSQTVEMLENITSFINLNLSVDTVSVPPLTDI